MFTLKIKKRGRRFTQRGGGKRGKAPTQIRPKPQLSRAQKDATRQAKFSKLSNADKTKYKANAQKRIEAEKIAAATRKAKKKENHEKRQAEQKKKGPQTSKGKKNKKNYNALNADKKKQLRKTRKAEAAKKKATRKAEAAKKKANRKAAAEKAAKKKAEEAAKRKEKKDAKKQGSSSSGFFGGLPGMLGALGTLGMAALSGLAALAGLAAQAAGALLGMLASAAKALFDVIGSLLSSIFDSLGGYTNAFKDEDGNPLPCKEQCEKIMANQSTATSNGDKKTLFEEIIRESFGKDPEPLDPDEKQKMCTMLSENGDDKTCNDKRILDLINEGNKMNSHNFYMFLTIWITAGYKCELTCGKGCKNCECEDDPDRKKICLSKQPAKGASS